MERKELIENLAKWQEADNDKRAIIVLTTELTGTDEPHKQYSLSAGLAGSGEHIVAMLKGAFKDCPDLPKLIRRACKELAAESMMKKFCKVAAEVINEIEEEEQK